MILIATRLPIVGSTPRYTVPIAPSPSLASIVNPPIASPMLVTARAPTGADGAVATVSPNATGIGVVMRVLGDAGAASVTLPPNGGSIIVFCESAPGCTSGTPSSGQTSVDAGQSRAHRGHRAELRPS